MTMYLGKVDYWVRPTRRSKARRYRMSFLFECDDWMQSFREGEKVAHANTPVNCVAVEMRECGSVKLPLALALQVRDGRLDKFLK